VTHSTSEVRPLGRDECLALLASTQRGRIAVSDRALPVIVPVRYELVGNDVVIECCTGVLASAAAGGHVVCLQTDVFDPAALLAWTVSVTGPLRVREWHATGAVTAALDTLTLSGCRIDEG
jgi:hypothetical protein